MRHISSFRVLLGVAWCLALLFVLAVDAPESNSVRPTGHGSLLYLIPLGVFACLTLLGNGSPPSRQRKSD